MRGEEQYVDSGDTQSSEIPPRARRRVTMAQKKNTDQGNTSACAEKRTWKPYTRHGTRKYLRVRGEEASFLRTRALLVEIPPRARRRGAAARLCVMATGNTSACAEKSHRRRRLADRHGKYLRVRGEERFVVVCAVKLQEIPPRARRRVRYAGAVGCSEGNTSACAEKRLGTCRRCLRRRKYLRVRGEEPLSRES